MIRSKKEFLKWYSATFVFIIFIILAPVAVKGRTLVTDSDCFNQYYPVFVYIGRYIREGFSNLRIKQFDFTIGLGEGVIPALNYYGFGDPLNLVSAFIPEKYAPYGFSALLIIRIYLCGISMAVYCRKNSKSWNTCMSAALAYAFSSFILIKGFQFYTYITAIMLLPLMIAGVNDILQGKKKISFCFIFSVFLQAVNGFYFVYMDTLFIFVYFMLFAWKFAESGRQAWKRGMMLAGQYALGFSIGAAILVPAVWGFLGSSRTGNAMTSPNLLFFSSNVYEDYIGNFLIARRYSNGELAFLAVEVVCLILLLSRKGKNYRAWKLLSVGALLGYFIPFTGYVMNGFAYSSDRWVYIIHFIMVMVMAEILEEKGILCGRDAVAYLSVIIITTAVHGFGSYEGAADIFRIFLYLIVEGLVFICFFYRKRKEWWISILVIINIILNGCMIFGPVKLGGGGYSASFLSKNDIEKGLIGSLPDEIRQNDRRWGRWDVYEGAYGAAMVGGV